MAKKEERKERPPECSHCRGRLNVFVSEGHCSSEGPFTQLQISPCRFCGKTERLRGMKEILEYLVERREDREW